MRIGIIGSGRIGSNAARLFTEAGHEVAVSNSRGPDSLGRLISELGPNAHAATVDEAARFGEVVFLAAPWSKSEALPSPATTSGKIVIDAMNPYTETGALFDLGGSTSSEEVRKRLPGSRLVKAFNTMYFQDLATRGKPDLPLDERNVIFVAGDDAGAKHVVNRLIEQIGFAPVDTGSLREGGLRQQPNSPIYNHLMTAREAERILSAWPRTAAG